MIFNTRQPFRDEYTPDEIVAHNETISELVNIFQEYIDGFQAPSLLIYGDYGTGKRTVVQHFLSIFENEIDRDIEILTVNCNKDTSLYQIFVELASRICEEDYPSGTHQDKLEKVILRRMDDPSTVWYIILENLEKFNECEIPFEEIQQSISTYGADRTECGVIGISNESALVESISMDVLQRPDMNILETTPYDAPQLQEILNLHADEAFRENALADAVIPKCAAIISQETGSARDALQLLELAGYVAYRNDESRVTLAHLDTATKSRDALNTYYTFKQDLTPKEQLICVIIAVHNKMDEKPISTDELYDKYDRECQSFNLDNISKRRVQQLIANLREKGVVRTQEHNIGRAGGTWSSHEVAIPPHEIFQPAVATTGRFVRYLRNNNISVDPLAIPNPEVNIQTFVSDSWS
ncbi:cell division control protein 6 [Halopenitus malekzadehii]|uniref:ORC1-type DNA replication protein n=1 Tax=Halopenitus malekzadehii TaxID=1267564 RepID=A0A1H6J5R1_9EURY|nr:hypothetical protein [Halopenitus malekzadehii]SEH54257.1 cell division control protein 6 [Halopenitus malekzadehii]